MTTTPEEVLASQTHTALNLLPAVFENPLVISGRTCVLCTGPLESGGPLCSQCDRVARNWPNLRLDAVIPLTYAGPRSPQAQQDLRQYKDGRTPELRADAAYRLSYLVWYFTAYHAKCTRRIHGRTEMVALVPSGRVSSRPGPHPLNSLDYFPRSIPRVAITRTIDAQPRAISPDSLNIDSEVAGKTVLLFDDTWTTRASLQSAAIALKRAGAAKVNAVVIGRWLNSGWGPTEALMRDTEARGWDARICPVTRGSCPAPGTGASG
jgi:hypothetical protein